MLSAVFATFLFAASILSARRSIAHVGTLRANFFRQLVALVLLGIWAHTWGQGLGGPTFGLLFLSGVIGFGLGDCALFEALPRIGPALTVLLFQCLAAPIGALAEWLWLGTKMSELQMVGSALSLLGVGLAVAPGREEKIPVGHRIAGICCAVLAAVGQGLGAVMSRVAFQQDRVAGFVLDGPTSAYQRLSGGAVSVGLFLLLSSLHTRWVRSEAKPPPREWRRAWPWIVGNALLGPTVGVSCYQWALKSSPSSVVLPIVATTPLVVMLLAFLGQGARPSRRMLLGSLLAIIGVVILVRNG